MSEWIDTRNAYPQYKDETKVFIFVDGVVKTAWWIPKNQVFAFVNEYVTHWMPYLPEPPK